MITTSLTSCRSWRPPKYSFVLLFHMVSLRSLKYFTVLRKSRSSWRLGSNLVGELNLQIECCSGSAQVLPRGLLLRVTSTSRRTSWSSVQPRQPLPIALYRACLTTPTRGAAQIELPFSVLIRQEVMELLVLLDSLQPLNCSNEGFGIV